MVSKRLRKVLICGLGSIGRRYLRIINKNWPDLKIAVMRSGYGSSCDEMKLIDYQTSNLRESIEWKPEAAIITSPACLHIDQAIALGNSGVPCLIEKPLGTGNEDFKKLEKIIQISESVPMLVGYILRHHPCANVVKEKLEENLLGKVVEADFHSGSWLPKWRPNVDYLTTVTASKKTGDTSNNIVPINRKQEANVSGQLSEEVNNSDIEYVKLPDTQSGVNANAAAGGISSKSPGDQLPNIPTSDFANNFVGLTESIYNVVV